MNLKELRINKNLSQQEASFICDVPLRTYKRIENDPSYLNSYKYKNAFSLLQKYKKNNITNKSYNIAIVGAGYVGFSLGILFSTKHNVSILDINEEKINKINERTTLFKDKDAEYCLKNKSLNLKGYLVDKNIYRHQDFVVISVPTDFVNEKNGYDMTSVTNTIKDIRSVNKKCLIVIKSTCPVGFTSSLDDRNIIFSPEFLREGKAIYDNLYPSRIIIGGNKSNKKVREFASLLLDTAINAPQVIYMSSSEAEAVKLFSNAYLAMRVSYFNELDSFASQNGLDSKNIIQGVSLDSRIGDYYNNPSFGFGGYCLPKDTSELISQMKNISNNDLISSIEKSNESRKDFIVSDIISKLNKPINESIIGIYSFESKKNSDNIRHASIIDVSNKLKDLGATILINDQSEEFKNKCDLIIANRYDSSLDEVKEKVYTRDLFIRD
ncbi:MAG: nucleotide sugar dehydrogenase [Bacilli bacterium]|nr:nucleotide sugar dehydrogenase [Bacilli bacterium]